MHAFDVVGDPVRRRILEMLADSDLAAGQVVTAIQREFGISQPAVSTHLRVLREAGFAHVRPEGARRLYAINPQGLQEVDAWLDRFRQLWTAPLDALKTELAQGKRQQQALAMPKSQTNSTSEGESRTS